MTNKLEEAITAIKSGDKKTGKQLLIDLLKSDQTNEHAWLWMTQVVNSDSERIKCLQNALKINPNSDAAKRGLDALQKRIEAVPQRIEPEEENVPSTVQISSEMLGPPTEKASSNVEELDVDQINRYVIKALDEFGMKKWGVGKQGCLFIKGKLYDVYYSKPEKLELFGDGERYTHPKWLVVAKQREVLFRGPRGSVI